MKLQKEVALYPGGGDTEGKTISSRMDINERDISFRVTKRHSVDGQPVEGDVLASINMSQESVKISASKIDIEGVATFGHFPTTETLNSQINSVKASANGRQQVIYFAKNNRTNPGANTTWVTAATGNGWVNVRPQYNSSTPILWTAVQSQTIDEKTGNTWSTSCDCTTPVVDETTTVIDGGHITTGLISANRIETGKLTIGYFNMSDSATKTAISNDTYISADNTGITLHPSNTTANKLTLTTSGIKLYQNNDEIASFGSSVTLGKTSGAYTTINSTSFNVIGTNQRKISIGFQSDSGKTVNIASYNSQNNALISRFALADDYAYLAVSNSRFYLQSQSFSLISGNTTIFDGGTNQIHFRQSSTFHGTLRTRFGTSDSNGEIGYMAYNNGSKSTAKDSWVDWSTVVNAGSRVMLTYSAKFTGRKGGRRGIRAVSGTNVIDGSTIMVGAESTSSDIYLSGCVPIDTHINGTGFNLGIQTYQSSGASLSVQIWLCVIVVG